MATVNIIGTSIIFIFLLFILMKKQKVASDYALIAVNMILATILLTHIWIEKDISAFSFVLHSIATFFLFPVALSYGMLLIENEQFNPKWLAFYGIALGFSIFILLDFTVLTDYTPQLITQQYESPSLIYHLFYKSNLLFSIALFTWFLRQLVIYRQQIKYFHSFIEPIRLQWLKIFVLIQIALHLLSLLSFLSYNFGWISDIALVYVVLNAATVLAIFYLSFHGIKQYNLAQFNAMIIEQKVSATPEQDILKPKTPSIETRSKSFVLPADRIDEIYEKVLHLFEKDHIYKEPNLKISTIAEVLEVSVHHLSMAINSKAGKPFYDFVNTYRVEDLKRKLKMPKNQQFTILSLAFDSGFNSKASLNRIFKQHTQLTPSQFQKAHLAK
ncbi:MAG: helix-turn-helix domain-containing protein [Bacteroidota bacterium]